MAKTAAALHILVKEEKLALDLLEQLKNGADFGKLAKNTLSARQANVAAIWVNSARARWFRHSIK